MNANLANPAPERYPRRILLCVTGLSPQIITETLFALACQRSPAFVPSEIHLITTREGADYARLTLLDPEQGRYHALCREFDLPSEQIRFDPQTIHVIGTEQPLDDIRSPQDNETAADCITALVRELSSDPDCAIHASIAGGRKTMGFYLGYALSLLGRPQDRLSHVLVTPPFESHPDFYYPPLKPRVLLTRENRPVSTADAAITLAEIPFVRLRETLPRALPSGHSGFSEAVRMAQSSLGPARLVLDLATRSLHCNDVPVALRPAEFAFITWLARRTRDGLPGLQRTAIGPAEAADYLTCYAALPGQHSGDVERVTRAVENGMEPEYFDQRRSNLHKALDQALGQAAGPAFHVHKSGKRPFTRYALRLEPDQIHIIDNLVTP